MISNRRKAAEAASLSRICTRILKGKKCNVKFLEEGPEVGYTNGATQTIYVAWDHELYQGLTENEKSVIRMGICGHEVLHQCLTNFKYTEIICNKLETRAKVGIFMTFANLLEDPAIEYFADSIMGGKMLKALRFTIRYIYDKSEGIESSKTAFSQLVNALVNFGDMGLVKGEFTFPEARKYFRKVASKFNQGITCPDSKKRLDIALECMEITRPLWEEEVKEKENMEKAMEELKKMLDSDFCHFSDEDFPIEESETSSSSSERRKKYIEKIEEEIESAEESESAETEGKESKGEESEGTESDGKESKGEASDGKESEGKASDGKESEGKASDGKESEGEASDGKESKGEASEGKESEGETSDGKESEGETSDGKESEGETSDGKESEGEAPEGTVSGGEPLKTEADELLSESDELIEDMMREEEAFIDIESLVKEVEEDIDSMERAIYAESGTSTSTESDFPDFTIENKFYHGITCLNRTIKVDYDKSIPRYKKKVSELKPKIKRFSKELENLFEADREEFSRHTNGKYNVLRGSMNTSAKIFDKKKEKAGLNDCEVVILVDQSGSMCLEHRMEQARDTAIVLSETFTALNIRHYVLGFSADNASKDGKRAEAVHNHFVKWDSKLADRSTMMAMEAHGNNFDGYSIRYAGNLLKDSNAKTRILFVISDGEPACDTYRGYSEGYVDTTNAIKEVKKHSVVFGIAIGNGVDASVHQQMYGKDFIYCEDPQNLTNLAAKKLKKLIMKQGN